MKKVLIIMMILLSFLLVACKSSNNNEDDEITDLTTWDTFYDNKEDVLKMYNDFMKVTLGKTNFKMTLKQGKGDQGDFGEIYEIDGTTAKVTTEGNIRYAYIKDGEYCYAITYKEDGNTRSEKSRDSYESTYNLYKGYTFSRYESFIDKKDPSRNTFEFTSEGKTYLKRGITNKEEFITMTIKKYDNGMLSILTIEAKAVN